MPQATIEQCMRIAEQHHRCGRLAQAEGLYRQVLEQEPNHPGALHLLGVIFHQVGQHDLAERLIRSAIALAPGEASFHSNLGEVFRSLQRWDDAVAAFSTAIRLKHDNAPAYNNLGNVLYLQGKLDQAIAAYTAAIQIKADYPDAYSKLGNLLREQARLDESVLAYKKARDLKPDDPEIHYKLASVLQDQVKLGEAIVAYSRAIQLRPQWAEAHGSLASAQHGQGCLTEAEANYSKAIQLKPEWAEAHNNLGNVLRDLGKLDEAIDACTRAIELYGSFPEAYYSLGNALQSQGKLRAAADAYSKAIELRPNYAKAFSNLGCALLLLGNPDESMLACQKAIELDPGFAPGLLNLANAYKEQGLLDDALAWYDKAIALAPKDPRIHSNRVYTLYFHPNYDAPSILSAHREWDLRHGVPLRQFAKQHLNARDADRRLKIGYTSPDFRDHVVGRNLIPLFRESDHQALEVFGYSDVVKPDGFTESFRTYCDQWRNTVALTHRQLCEQIRADRIDVLVDLTLHMAGNRLPVFAMKPAPVQVTWLGYPGTTGLSAIDYRLTDPYLDPPGQYDEDYVERSIRLPYSFVCYEEKAMSMGLASVPQVGALPALQNGYVTFGSLNNFCKINVPLLEVWADVLRAIEGSRLLLLAHEGAHRQRLLDWFAEHAIDPGRIGFLPSRPRLQYLEYYNQVDVGLDTFPYGGYTTSLDSYWMGVPVITLSGRTAVGRAGVSHVMNLGLPQLLAHSPQQYVEIARKVASDLPRLAELRAGLRQRLNCSPLSDARRFARDIQEAYRKMWRWWCERKP